PDASERASLSDPTAEQASDAAFDDPAERRRRGSEPSSSGAHLAGGSSARDAASDALSDHLHLVHGVVARLARRLPANLQRDGLLAAGLFGLVVALRRNGGAGGATFEWYARIRIRGAIVDELRAQDWLSRRARDRATSQKEAGGGGAAFVSLEEASIECELG